jgi:hypothetical protein
MAHSATKIQNQLAALPSVDVTAFERELTEISRKYGIGLTGTMTLFIMESDDFERKYSSDAQSRWNLPKAISRSVLSLDLAVIQARYQRPDWL